MRDGRALGRVVGAVEGRMVGALVGTRDGELVVGTARDKTAGVAGGFAGVGDFFEELGEEYLDGDGFRLKGFASPVAMRRMTVRTRTMAPHPPHMIVAVCVCREGKKGKMRCGWCGVQERGRMSSVTARAKVDGRCPVFERP